ncbi:MAG: S9 family peptidase [Cryomorphaceae bacterium MED-G11]|nr:MAG: S9 family peptidase [Cryomorphaceae bacterium MED-G11]
MKFFLKLFPLFIFIISCTESEKNIEQYSIETLMSNNRSSGGYFSKDADKLIYSSDKSGIFNIYEVDLSANEETQLTDSKEESFFVRGYSPNTGEVIYSADKGGNENSHIYLIREGKSIDITPGENTKASFVGWTKDELGMYFISNSRDPRFFDLYKIDIVTLNSEMVFKNDSGYNLNSISNNDNYLVLSLNISRSEQKLFLYDLKSNQQVEISNQAANFSGQNFDKNDENYFYTTNYDSEFYYLMSYNLKNGERSIEYKTNWDVAFSYLSKNNSYRVIAVNEDAQNKLTIKNMSDQSDLNLIGFDNMNINSVGFSEDEKLLRVSAGSPNSPGDIYTYELSTNKLNKITSNLNSNVNPDDLVNAEVIRYESFDGLEIPAILYKPHTANKKNKVPALVWVHGGPGGQSRVGYRALIQYLVNHGYAILAVNNRGSSGYGKTFYSLDDLNHGEDDLQDCVWGKKWLQDQDYINPDKIGIIGGSYGGFMTMAAMTFEPEEFKVGVNIYGVTNWIRTLRSIPAFWEATRKSLYKEMGDPYSKDSLRLYDISPLFHAKNIKNPIMVLQGANDPRVLQIESDEMVQEARNAGAYVEYVLFEDAGHGFVKKEQQIEGNQKILTFLDNYLK